ncbi:MAG: alpha/beta hydrolase [Bacteroidales bacterium]|nr:alpha/beta hydrolase [Bacteroidales bacterium]MBN2749571.1 alpha/beta hydrolase [Bacteroidales bacterium]
MFKNQFIKWPNGSIAYKEGGAGRPVVLLHGYLESKNIWGDFAISLCERYRVICIDTPGHGLSHFTGDELTMELAAEAVLLVLDDLGVTTAALIGHSMGGYVAMAFAECFPARLAGLCLFHSTPNADTDEKRKNRYREVDLVLRGKKELIVSSSIPNAFAADSLPLMVAQVERAKQIALSTPTTGIAAALRGMALRKDRNGVLAGLTVPSLLLMGEKDSYIPSSVAMLLKEKHHHSKVVMLSNSGHMGFLEQPNQATIAITSFLGDVFV